MSYDEADVQWNRVFVLLFVAATVAWLCAIPFVSMRTFVVGAGGTFALLEALGLRHHRDRLPPLTFITRRYLPRWLTVTVVGFFAGLAGGYWFQLAHPVQLACLFALYSWLESHFDVTYDSDG